MKNVIRFKLYTLFHIHAYCLCGNHFHLAVKTRTAAEILLQLEKRPVESFTEKDHLYFGGAMDYTSYVYTSFAGTLSGFARRTNNQHGLEGQLLISPTLHGLTDKGTPGIEFSRRLIAYVGLNYVKHRLATFDDKYLLSSFHNAQFGIVDYANLYALFGGEEAYRKYHKSYLQKYGNSFRSFNEDRFFEALTPRRFSEEVKSWREGDWRPKSLLY